MMPLGPKDRLGSVFVQNRTEELGADVWRQFVVPPFFERLELKETKKPSRIVGGRGCGKTMLLRYLSYTSTLSQDRGKIPQDILGHVGLYWRADTQFARMLNGRGVAPEDWSAAFDHLLALVVALELIKSVSALSKAGVLPMTADEIDKVVLGAVGDFMRIDDPSLSTVRRKIGQELRAFELWAPNVGRAEMPVFLPGRAFLEALIADLVDSSAVLADAVFFVYIDEYENLLEYQQRLVNTHMKHSTPPLIFNVAMKRNGFQTRRTVGEESIVEPDDYRTHDIEDYLAPDFTIFASEVLLLMLSLANWEVPIDVSMLRDPGRLLERHEVEHRERVLETLRQVLPKMSGEQIAGEVFKDSVLRSALRRRIAAGLKARGEATSPDALFLEDEPRATIVASALVHRRQPTARVIEEEMIKLSQGKPNHFTGDRNWIHNNFVGSAIAVYESVGRLCPVYGGLDTFALLSRNNMRHFLELCYQSLSGLNGREALEHVGIDPHDQAKAARKAAVTFLRQVRSFGRQGNRLHAFVLRLGSLFSLAHKRASQSEPEQTHFTVTKGSSRWDSDLEKFLEEAVKWSVLFEEEATKKKDPLSHDEYQYILNPIYSPFFHISYRKKRRLEISVDELRTLATGSYDEVQQLLRRFVSKWSVDLGEANFSLFSHLEEG